MMKNKPRISKAIMLIALILIFLSIGTLFIVFGDWKTLLQFVGLIISVTVLFLLARYRESVSGDKHTGTDWLSKRVAKKKDQISHHNRMSGDSSTDAPPPDKK